MTVTLDTLREGRGYDIHTVNSPDPTRYELREGLVVTMPSHTIDMVERIENAPFNIGMRGAFLRCAMIVGEDWPDDITGISLDMVNRLTADFFCLCAGIVTRPGPSSIT